MLIEEIDALYVEHAGPESPSTILSREQVRERLTVWSKALLESLPAFIQEEVCVCGGGGTFLLRCVVIKIICYVPGIHVFLETGFACERYLCMRCPRAQVLNLIGYQISGLIGS